jgi:prepilin-type processing-associated H-X9-DG protein
MPRFVKNFCRTGIRPRQRHGMSRSEFVVVAASLLTVMSIGIPSLMQVRAKSRRQFCELRLARLGVALQQFEAEFAEFPGFQNRKQQAPPSGTGPAGWAATVLPYLTSTSGENPPRPDRSFGTAEYVAELNCPATGAQAGPVLKYVANCGMPDAPRPPWDFRANGVFLNRVSGIDHVDRGYLQRHDGESSTLLLSENLDAGRWTDNDEYTTGFVWRAAFREGIPAPGRELFGINQHAEAGGSVEPSRLARPSSHHPRGVNYLMADGSTGFLEERIDYLVFVQLMTPDDEGTIVPETGEPPPAPYRRPPSGAATSTIPGLSGGQTAWREP